MEQEGQGAEDLQEVITLDMEEEEELAGGEQSVGGGGTEERVVGTVAIVDQGSTRTAPTSSIPEVQGAINHSLRVSLGLSPPARAILICPLPALPDPPPAPPAGATPQFSRLARRLLEQEPAPSRKQPARSSSRPTGPALRSQQGTRPKVPQAPVPAPSTGERWQLLALPQGYTFGSVPPGVTLETRTLAGLPKKSGYRWEQRQHPYAPWSPNQEELWRR